MDHQKYDEDDHLLDDLMNIVQNDDSIKKFEAIQSGSNNNETNEPDLSVVDGEEDYCDDDFDEEEMFVDQMLEKPIDILDDKDQVNFYTYDKIQINKLKFFFK